MEAYVCREYNPSGEEVAVQVVEGWEDAQQWAQDALRDEATGVSHRAWMAQQALRSLEDAYEEDWEAEVAGAPGWKGDRWTIDKVEGVQAAEILADAGFSYEREDPWR